MTLGKRDIIGRLRVIGTGTYIDVYKHRNQTKYVASIYGQLSIPFEDGEVDYLEDEEITALVSKIFQKFQKPLEMQIGDKWLEL